MIRKFKLGDRVQTKHGSPTMEVIKYVVDHNLVSGNSTSDHHVKCVWYESGERKTEVFDQRTLFQIHEGGSLFTD